MARISTGSSQSELQGTVENRSSVPSAVAFVILRSWKDGHLQTSEYSLQVKCNGEVITTTENAQITPVKSGFNTVRLTLRFT